MTTKDYINLSKGGACTVVSNKYSGHGFIKGETICFVSRDSDYDGLFRGRNSRRSIKWWVDKRDIKLIKKS